MLKELLHASVVRLQMFKEESLFLIFFSIENSILIEEKQGKTNVKTFQMSPGDMSTTNFVSSFVSS